jgi:hypothetical protein
MSPQAKAIRLSACIAVASIVVISLARVSRVQAESPPTPAASQAPVYVPSVSDLMIATIQPRHVRLWRAEQDRNWEFAGYELGNLKGAFRRVGIAHPVQGDVPLKDMIDSVTQEPFSDLEKAIKAKQPAAFEQAYSGLTTACNTCHESVNHSTIKIKVPAAETTGLENDLDLSPAAR